MHRAPPCHSPCLCPRPRPQRALERHGGGGTTCIGQDCFQATFVTLAVLGLGATAASVALHRRNAELYMAEYRELHSYDAEVQRSLASLSRPTTPGSEAH